MHKVLKALTAIALTCAGGTALAGVAYLQANPLALTTSARSGSASPGSPAVRDSEQLSPYLPLTPQMAQVVDRRTLPALRPARYESTVSAERKGGAIFREPARLTPCSGWIDLGPKSLAVGDQHPRRLVRVLCPEDVPASDYYHPTG